MKCEKCDREISRFQRVNDYYLELKNIPLIQDGETINYRENVIIEGKVVFCSLSCLASWVKNNIIERKNLTSESLDILPIKITKEITLDEPYFIEI